MFRVVLSHPGLQKSRVITGRDQWEVEQKARLQRLAWEEAWAKKLEAEERRVRREELIRDKAGRVALAAERTAEAERAVLELEGILQSAIGAGYPDFWELVRDNSPFTKAKPLAPDKPAPPTKPSRDLVPPRPSPTDVAYGPQFGLLDRLSSARKQARIDEAEERYQNDLEEWKNHVRRFNDRVEAYNQTLRRIKVDHQKALSAHQLALARWENERRQFEEERQRHLDLIESQRAQRLQHAPEAVVDYADLVLSNSHYPEFFPKDFELEYLRESKTLIVDYQLPNTGDIPSLKSVRYNQSQDRFVETLLSEAARNKLYEEVTYQICLRVLYELFQTDDAKAFDSIVLNGLVSTIDKATGQPVMPCIMTVQVSRDEFTAINMEHVEPKACFKRLKGVSAARLHTVTPVAPVAQITKEDRRFVESYRGRQGLRGYPES